MKPEEKIRQGYISYLLEQHHVPKSVYTLCKTIDMKEEEFYDHYASVNSIENDIWLHFFEETTSRIEQDEVFASYTVREKVLAFYYTWLEVLKGNRSFVIAVYQAKKDRGLRLDDFKVLKAFKEAYIEYMGNLVNEGLESGEIAERPYITTRYSKALWFQALSILKFWIKDNSKAFEKTDGFVEKAANLGFDLMGKNSLDSAFDFVKFAIQNRK